jgi:hypothetical protein
MTIVRTESVSLDDVERRIKRHLTPFSGNRKATSTRPWTTAHASLPFPIKKLPSDNGTEFPLEFALTVQAAGIRHREGTPRAKRSQQN